MPAYLPLEGARQGLLPDDCRSCAWWQTSGAWNFHGTAAAGKRQEWLAGLEREWGSVGMVAHEPAIGRDRAAGADVSDRQPVVASLHFAPASSLARFRELPFAPLPPSSALLFCLHVNSDAPRWVPKRLIRKAIYQLHRRGIDEVYAVARRAATGESGEADCRFFQAALLLESGFSEADCQGPLCLMRVDNRTLLTLVDQVAQVVRRLFGQDREPAPSPAAWAVASQPPATAAQKDPE